MKTPWSSLLSLSLASVVVAHAAGGCADAQSDAPGSDAAVPDSGSETGVATDAGLDATRPLDGSVACSPGDFCPTTLPGSPAPRLNGIAAVSAARAVAVTNDGRILLWEGSAWSTLAQGFGSLLAIWAVDDRTFLIAEDKTWALTRLTLGAAGPELAQETLPFDSACAPAGISISGTSASDVFVAAYCRAVDQETFTVGYAGVLFHATAGDAGVGTRSWSVRWSAGGPHLEAVALGSVIAVAPDEALAGGWRSSPEMYPTPTTLRTPVVGDATQPGTTTFVLQAKGAVVTKQDLPPAMAMCVQSIWASPTTREVFLAGVCNAIDVSDVADTKTMYTTVAHRSLLADGGAGGWAPVVRGAYATFFDLPGTLAGAGTNDVYAAGSYLVHWDGAAFQLVNTATGDSPLGGRVRAVQGISTNDLWIVGDGFAWHRKL